jgi:hypothetical protein
LLVQLFILSFKQLEGWRYADAEVEGRLEQKEKFEPDVRIIFSNKLLLKNPHTIYSMGHKSFKLKSWLG